MPGGQAQRIRKGAKSCAECKWRQSHDMANLNLVFLIPTAGRRRKIRCIQSFGDAQTCRRCEEQGLKCIAQTHTSQSTATQKSSSRHRLAQLELKVLSLTKTVREIQLELKSQTTQSAELSVGQTFGIDNSDGSSTVSERSIAEQPFHLRLLFENDWLSVDDSQERQPIQGHGAPATARLLYVARESLQRLIPSKDELFDLTKSASDCLTMLHSLFPLPSMAKCQEEVVACYEEMHSPNVDAIRLASWLLTIALIAEQLPQEPESTTAWLEKCEGQKGLSKAISDTVENKILAHDRLIRSIQGLSTSMQFIRL